MKTPLLTALSIVALSAAQASAADFTVTSLFDSGPGTLRDCLTQANALPGPHTVTFHPALSGSVRPMSELLITEPVTIIGPESRAISIDGSLTGYLIRITGDLTPIEVGLLDLEFRNGYAAVRIERKLRLNVHRCVFRDFGNDGMGFAGAFDTTWSTAKSITGTVRSSSFINNRGTYAGVVITVAEPSGEPLEFINCTFCGNSSTNGASVAWIWNGNTVGQGITHFINCTMTGNQGGTFGNAGGAIVNTNSTPACRVKNCIMAENTADDGLDPNFTGSHGLTGNILEGVNIFSNAMLSPLQVVNGMYVRTPLPGSPCIDAAFPDTEVITDQLGKSRPFMVPGTTPAPGSDGSDVGAVERQSGSCGLADINGNGRVDGADLSVILSTFGSSCP